MSRNAVLAVGTAALLVTSCGLGTAPLPGPRPTPGRLVVTTWVADPAVTNGPYPGFRPKLTDVTPDMLTSAQAGLDPNGGSRWVLTLTFNQAGATIYRRLTTDAYHACGSSGTGSCPGSRITMWLDLTEADIDDWNAQANTLYQPADAGGKLLADPYVQSPITDGIVLIDGAFNQRQATNLAARLHA